MLNLTVSTNLSWPVTGCYGSDVSQCTFPLPCLGDRLISMAEELHESKGYCFVRGLNLQGLSCEDATIIYLGISSYIGEQRAMQDKDGNMLGESDKTSHTRKAWTSC